MIELENKEGQIIVDDAGYLVNFNDWNERVARELAARGGIEELVPESLAMLTFIRDYYKAYGFFPIVNSICRNVHARKNCVSERFFNPLIAWKIAGLPHPDDVIINLLEAGQSPG